MVSFWQNFLKKRFTAAFSTFWVIWPWRIRFRYLFLILVVPFARNRSSKSKKVKNDKKNIFDFFGFLGNLKTENSIFERIFKFWCLIFAIWTQKSQKWLSKFLLIFRFFWVIWRWRLWFKNFEFWVFHSSEILRRSKSEISMLYLKWL